MVVGGGKEVREASDMCLIHTRNDLLHLMHASTIVLRSQCLVFIKYLLKSLIIMSSPQILHHWVPNQCV